MSLLTGKLHEEKKTENLKIFTAGYVGKFRNLAGNIDGAVGSDFYSRITNDVDHLVTFRNICLQQVTFPRACKMKLIII